jgi:glycosyltransferase involved in cell wall biosynthesis
MKRALIITYYWPPSGGAGIQRWLKFVKYLREFDWEPVIYTPENPENPETDLSLFQDIPADLEVLKRPIWEPYNLYKKFIGQKTDEKIHSAFLSEHRKKPLIENFSVWLRGNFFIPDARKFWIRPSVHYLTRYLGNHPVNVIISTGPPHSMHLIALPLAKKFNVPWLADFRDPWTEIDFYQELRLTPWADRKHRQLEKEVLQAAGTVTVISDGMAESFYRIHPRLYHVITNGFDEDDIAPPEYSLSVDSHFSIAHIGTLVSTRNPITFWDALKQAIIEQPGLSDDLEIKLVGKVDWTVQNSIEQFGLSKFIRRMEYLPHREAIRQQQHSRILLLIINNTPNAGMILTGKFFEYLAARRPILCLGPVHGDAAKILDETHSGLIVGFGDSRKMKEHILILYRLYKNNALVSTTQNIDLYARKNLTSKLASILNNMVSAG